MDTDDGRVKKTFDGLLREQLLIYARELGEHVQKERQLQGVLSEREQQLRKLAAATIAAQEKERQWIACEVHDRIAQALVSIYHQLQILESATPGGDIQLEIVQRATALVKEAISETRNIMTDLHPPVLDEFGVVPLMEEELGRFQRDTGIQATLVADYQVRAPREIEVVLYRIFHEALTNIRRHARGAKNVRVAIDRTGDSIDLMVADDGPGFDVGAAAKTRHIGGLMSMRHRAEIVGGRFEIKSNRGQGATVAVSVALPGESG
ncbi:MAG: sensor histidine kinase [Chloroflexi bacterium]|nr:sensor histidine kinase [Chloroflexota bacterium]